jgi:hypothetical protein
MTPDPTTPVDAGDDDAEVYLPDPEEIAGACRLFQMGWSDAERIKRRRSRPGRVADAVGVEAAARTRLEFALSRRRGG